MHSFTSTLDKQTNSIIDHFPSINDRKLLYYKKYDEIKHNLNVSILTSICLIIICSVLLLMTIKYLNIVEFSLFPVFLLSILALSIMTLIINNYRYKICENLILKKDEFNYHLLSITILVQFWENPDLLENKENNMFYLNLIKNLKTN